jgi:hypothetical protein
MLGILYLGSIKDKSSETNPPPLLGSLIAAALVTSFLQDQDATHGDL